MLTHCTIAYILQNVKDFISLSYIKPYPAKLIYLNF